MKLRQPPSNVYCETSIIGLDVREVSVPNKFPVPRPHQVGAQEVD
jgi:hypothetical protein